MSSEASLSTIKKLFGDRLRALRDGLGLSQQDLSNASGVSKVFLGTVERGEKAPTIETVEKLALGLKAKPAALFRFESQEEAETDADKLGRKVAALAKGATRARIFGFETVARIFFDKAGGSEKKPRSKRKVRKRRASKKAKA